MKIHRVSRFRNEEGDRNWFREWVHNLEAATGRKYISKQIKSLLGFTQVWETGDLHADTTVVIFPGARTTALIWDFDRGLDHLGNGVRIVMIETNGLPNLSDGATPDIHTSGYGEWAADLFNTLGIESAYVAGASFGGLVAAKLAIIAPRKVRALFLLNPGCLQSFSLRFRNIYYNLLPIIRPTDRNVRKFLDKAVFCKPVHSLSDVSEKMVVDYELFAIRRYIDRTQKPYAMKDELRKLQTPTYVLLGDKDLLFPYERSRRNAETYIRPLKTVKVFANVGHGIETHAEALKQVRAWIDSADTTGHH